ncbi:MAG TPA: 50S ribosomal protein L23 [Terriglobales bacterium]|nr:50S ribosomal protein L23 [Terriglobales bacterium]
MKSAYQIIRRPVITEKAERAKEFDPKAAKDKTSRKKEATSGQLVFEVASKATKTEIKEAVQQVFKVKVDSVRTSIAHGKERRRGRFAGHRPDWKKAYVRLKVGEKMPEYADNA